MKQMEDNIWEL